MIFTKILAPLALLSIALSAQTLESLITHGVTASKLTYKGKSAIRAVPSPITEGDGLLILKNSNFHNGTIEVELAGAPGAGAGAAARGFVGVAFRVTPDLSKFECIYLRPTNGRAEDQLRRNHSVQYVSYPDYPWERLRKENPAEYETYADLIPGDWTKVKIEVQGAKAKLWVNEAPQPTFLVNDLKHGDSHGSIALWLGPGTEAHFTNLRLTTH